MANKNTYRTLLRDRGFQAFLWTQFLGAFNDNVYRMIVSVGAVELTASRVLGARYLALAGAVFVLPFLIFAGYAGQIADRFSKTRVLQVTKAFEILVMLAGMAALEARSVNLLLVVLFLLAMQANMFSPAKYGILPEMLSETQLSRANGLLEFTTFAAIVLGTSAGTMLFARWKDQPLTMGGLLLAIAIVGSALSLFIRRTPAAAAGRTFRWNPLDEVKLGAIRMAGDRALWLTVAGMSYFWFIGTLFQLDVILLGSESLHLSDTHTGLLVTVLAFGIGVGSIAAGWLSGDHIEIGLVPCGALLLGVFSIATGMAHSFWQAAFCLAGAAFAGGLFIVPLNAWLQDAAGPQEKGRLLATNNFVNALGILLASGTLWMLHELLDWRASRIMVAAGILTLAATVVIAWIVPSSMIRFAIWSVSRVLFRVRVVGAENIPQSGGALLVSNHVSYADAVLIGSLTPRTIRFLMWQPLYEKWWLKPVVHLFDAIPLPQGSAREAIRPLRRAHAGLQAGELVAIFPEGQLTRTAQVEPFERGVELITRGLESTPVIPIYLDGLWGHALSLKGGRIFSSRLRLRHPVTIRVGKPFAANATAAGMRQRVLELGAEASTDNTLAQGFVRAARRSWSSVALADSTGRSLSYGETLTAALLMRSWLKSRAECVGLMFPASVGGAIANLGVTLAGKTAVNLNFTAGEENLRHAVRACGIDTVLSSREFLEKAKLPEPPGVVFIEDVMAGFTPWQKFGAALAARLIPVKSVRADDCAAILFSSGSTGTPKGVMLSHRNIVMNAQAAAAVFSVDRRDSILGVLPFFHSFGYTYTLWFPLLNGFKAVFHANPLDAGTIGEMAAAHRPTLLVSTPTFCLSYLRKCRREQFASIRHLLVGAEKLQPKLAAAFEDKFGIELLEGYGCTEMGPAVSVNLGSGPRRAGSVGRPLPNVAVRIVDPSTMAPVGEGNTGLVLVNGPGRMLGYLNDTERTAQSLHEGYYVTGDLGCVDSEGFLHIVDRLARFSKIAGEMVPHGKIEEVLREVPGSGSCVVTGVPDERRGERLEVVYTGNTAPTEMIQHLESCGLPALWIPKRDQFHRVDAIPLLGSGKVDLVAVRKMAEA